MATDPKIDEVQGIALMTKDTAGRLSEKQRVDYGEEIRSLLKWLLSAGKDPERLKGYAQSTVYTSTNHIDVWARWVWDEEGYTSTFTHDHADDYLFHLGTQTDYSDYYLASIFKTLKRYFKWQVHERNGTEWEPQYSFNDPSSTKPQDYLSIEERERLRDAALDYRGVPHYKSLNPQERSRWKAHLAVRFEKPKSEITPDDFERANGWKFTSLVWVSLDVGLRPVEVERAKTSWFQVEDRENPKVVIPADDSTKNTEYWDVPLTRKTGEAVKRWLKEREAYPKYDDSDVMWLTRESNPYASSSLRYLLIQLCEEARIEVEDRRMSWYAIRHSVGTHLAQTKDLKHAQRVLRHKRTETTMKYNHPNEDQIRDGQGKIG